MNSVKIPNTEWQSLVSNKKWVAFVDEFSPLNENNMIVFFDSDNGQQLGTAVIYNYFEVLYKNEKTLYPCPSVPQARNGAVKQIYFEWCEKRNLRPNPNEGWFKSKKFTKYLSDIGYSTEHNYVLFLTNIESSKIKEEVL